MKKMSVSAITTCALMAALMCVLGPMSVPIGPIPITLTNLVVYLTVFLLGWKGAAVSTVVYLLLGAVGMPVFSGFQGGFAKLAGPTGGFLIGFVFVALIGGFIVDKFQRKLIPSFLGLVLGTAVLYLFGTVWFVILMDSTVAHALSVCVVPFLPFDLGKIVAALVLGKAVRTGLEKANLIK